MASPAEIANDMAAHARYWDGRNNDIARACRDAAREIRNALNGIECDGRTWGGLHRRLLRLEGAERYARGLPNFLRARLTLEDLRRGEHARNERAER